MVDAREHDPGQADAIVEGAREVDRILAGERVGDEQHLVRIGGALDVGGLRHHRFIERGAAGSVEDDRVVAAEAARLQCALGNLRRLLACDDRQRVDVDLLPEHGQLFHRCGSAHVERGHEHLAPRLLDEALGELGGGGGLARALQTDHHDRHRRRGIEIDRLAARAEDVDQLVVHDLHHHLAGRHRFDDLDPDGVALHLVDEGARHVERDVGFEQGAPHFAQRGIDVLLGERAAARQAIENAAEPFGERIEHLDLHPPFSMDARVKPGHDVVKTSRARKRRPNTYGARGRIALSGGGLRPPGPVGGLHFGSWRERAEPMDAAARSQERRRDDEPQSKASLTPAKAAIQSLGAASPQPLTHRSVFRYSRSTKPQSGRSATGGSPMQIMRVLLIALGLISVSAVQTWSQPSATDYPNRQVNLIVPFAPGGGTDILGRLIGQKLSDRFGKAFVVENRPGAGTVTAAVQVAKSAPDGYTIMMATSGTMAMNTTLYKKLHYDPGKDLVLVALVCNVPFVLVVNPALPVNSVADLVKLAKEQPLSYGSGGAGAFHHLMGELLKTTLGIPMTHVPYKGTLPALNDVIAGHIQLMFSDLAPAYPLIQAGKLRALGVTTAQRAAAAPDIPPLADVGVPGFDWAAWQSVAAPGGTPTEIIAKLNGAVNAAIAESEVEKQLVGLQFIPVGRGSPEELDRFVKSETVRWAKVLQQAGVAGSE